MSSDNATSTDQADAAGAAVLETAELLEHIINFLPPKEILTTQRACRQFHELFKTSIKLQEKLWFRLPVRRGPVEEWRTSGWWPIIFEKLTAESTEQDRNSPYALDVASFNPFLLSQARCDDYHARDIECYSGERLRLLNVGIMISVLKRHLRESFRDMWLFNVPSAGNLTFVIDAGIEGSRGEASMHIEFYMQLGFNVTFSKLVDEFWDHVFHPPYDDMTAVRTISGCDNERLWPRGLTLRAFIKGLEQELGGSLKLDNGVISARGIVCPHEEDRMAVEEMSRTEKASDG